MDIIDEAQELFKKTSDPAALKKGLDKLIRRTDDLLEKAALSRYYEAIAMRNPADIGDE